MFRIFQSWPRMRTTVIRQESYLLMVLNEEILHWHKMKPRADEDGSHQCQGLRIVPLLLVLIPNICLFSSISFTLCSASYIFSALPSSSRSEICVWFKLNWLAQLWKSTSALCWTKRIKENKKNLFRNVIYSIYLTPCSYGKITHVFD